MVVVSHSGLAADLECVVARRRLPVELEDGGVAHLDPEAPIVICGEPIRIAHVPGHSLDSLTFYLKDEGLVFAGDTLFASSVGRTDLPGGSTEQLVSGIQKHLLSLPEETRVLSGHGPETTIGQEAKTNPFL